MEYRLNVNNSWKLSLEKEFLKDYYIRLLDFLKLENSVSTVFPPSSEVFSALNSTPLKEVKVVIIGQDPYHGENQANGLCFSVNKGVKLPPSLRNIYKEIEADLNIEMSKSGDLKSWARQGVLLLNTVLTVRESEAGSHQNRGWEEFTDAIINEINEKKQHVVFILWGGKAKKKARFIDRKKHFVLESSHPSPLSSYRGFFGCKHFSKANDYLESVGETKINWMV